MKFILAFIQVTQTCSDILELLLGYPCNRSITERVFPERNLIHELPLIGLINPVFFNQSDLNI